MIGWSYIFDEEGDRLQNIVIGSIPVIGMFVVICVALLIFVPHWYKWVREILAIGCIVYITFYYIGWGLISYRGEKANRRKE